MKDLDINNDNMISYDEFQTWWLSGKQGLSPNMKQMLGYKLKAVNALNSLSGNIKEIIEETSKEYKEEDMQDSSFKIRVN